MPPGTTGWTTAGPWSPAGGPTSWSSPISPPRGPSGSSAVAWRWRATAAASLVPADGEQGLALLHLPSAGLMSDRPSEEVQGAMRDLLAAAGGLGARLRDPFMAMSFLGLEVIPALKITDFGLIDVAK